MNDCFWCWVEVCEECNFGKCFDFISVHCDLGGQMLEAYKRDVEKALEPVREKWARKKGANDAD